MHRAATAGNPAAMTKLVSWYGEGHRHVRRSPRRCAYWFERLKKSARAGNPLAARLIGIDYLWGYGPCRRDWERARYWLRRAELAGDCEAKRLLREKFHAATEAEANYKRWLRNSDSGTMLHFLRRSAEAGYTDAMDALIIGYSNGDYALPKNAKLAASWRRRLARAARDGDAFAQFEMGWHAKDERTAADWYRKAAKNGYGEAAIQLRSHYSRSDAERERWFLRALELGHTDALIICARPYWKNGRPQPKAIALLEQATDAHEVREIIDRVRRPRHIDRRPSRERPNAMDRRPLPIRCKPHEYYSRDFLWRHIGALVAGQPSS